MPDDIPDSIAAPDASQGGPQGGAPAPFMDSAAALLGGAPDPSAGGMSVQPSQPSETTLQPNPIADYPSSPREDQHMGLIHRILDKASSILGGDETLHIKKDTEGNVTVTRDPSTQGEKWGRVAAAALGGLASGLPQSFGPQGVANAASAGFKTGAAMPQQREQQAQEQATAEQKQTMDRANNALIHQRMYQAMLTSQAQEMELGKAEADTLNAHRDELLNDPNAKDYGPINGDADLTRISSTDSDFLKHHANLQLKAVPLPDGKGHWQLHAVATDPGEDNQPTTSSDQVHVFGTDENGKPTLTTKNAAAGQKKGALRLSNQATDLQFMNAMNSWTKNNKPPAPPKTAEEALAAANAATDPIAKAQYTQLAKDMANLKNQMTPYQREELAARWAAIEQRQKDQGPPLTTESMQTWGDQLSDPRSNVTLGNVPEKQRGAILDDMKRRGLRVAKPLTADELKRSDLANNAVSNIDKALGILDQHPEMFGPEGWLSTKFAKALKGGNKDAQSFLTLMSLANLPAVGIHGVRGKWALEDLSKYDSDLYNNADSMRAALNDIKASAQEFAPAGGRILPTATASAAPQGGGNKPNLPPAHDYSKVLGDGKGNFIEQQGNQWVNVAPPPAR